MLLVHPDYNQTSLDQEQHPLLARGRSEKGRELSVEVTAIVTNNFSKELFITCYCLCFAASSFIDNQIKHD